MSTAKSTQEAPDPTADRLDADVSEGLREVDRGASEATSALQRIGQARLAQQRRAAAAASAEYGADAPETRAADAAVATSNLRVARVAAAQLQLGTAMPDVAKTGWALQGRVFDSNLRPMPRLTVFLVDAQKAYRPDYGFAYTDETGYFLIRHANADAKGQDTPALYVEIANERAKPIFLAEDPFEPTTGSATYRNFVLPEKAPPLGDLPAAIKATALPDTRTK